MPMADVQMVDRVIVLMPETLLRRIEEYRYAKHIPSRAEAIRLLIDAALRADADILKRRKPTP